jgi:hypothetical protein
VWFGHRAVLDGSAFLLGDCLAGDLQVEETALVGPQVALAVLERGQQVLQQDPDPRCLEWIGGRLNPKVGDARGQLLQGSKAVLEQLQGDGGGCQTKHQSDATA